MGSVEMSLFHLLNTMRFSNSFVIFLIFSVVAERVSSFSHQPGDRGDLEDWREYLELRELEEDAAKNSIVTYDKQAVEAEGNITALEGAVREACQCEVERLESIGVFILHYTSAEHMSSSDIKKVPGIIHAD